MATPSKVSTVVKAKTHLFDIFGSGAPFVSAIVNSILGLVLILVLIVFTVKITQLIIKAKITEGEDERAILRKQTWRVVIGFILAATSSTTMIIAINIIPIPKGKISDSSLFDALGSNKGEVRKGSNWLMAILTAIGIVIFLATTPWKIIKWMTADDDSKQLKRKGILRNFLLLAALLTVTLGVSIMANVIPNPSSL